LNDILRTRQPFSAWNLSEGNLSEGIFQKIFSAKPESFRKYFQQNWNLSEWNLSGKIFQKEICQKESFRRNLSETTL
jgi:hypothetical protein